ncbi:uncharacterized protein N7500_001998 [Penicillium coprophilum]|uniref:uncharacterized protein n=1 Tax=Penicillium coprophilum TaxID=36646 RepID=UPI0023925089|nr:uncharacterized protein N7500_001998 [Penicillium coprophilum]KAJ5174067.1 hypothetical protein N7500_001998 [Penicillium coprophilum]
MDLAHDIAELTHGEGDVEQIQVKSLSLQGGGARQMTRLETISASWVICDSWAGMAGTVSLAIAQGGPVTLVYGPILTLILIGACALTLAELASVYPTAGGQYHWTSILAPKSMNRALSYCCGMTNVFSWIAICTGIAIIPAQLIVGIALFYNPDYTPQAWHYFLIYQAINGLVLLYNITLLKRSLWIHDVASSLSLLLHVSLGHLPTINPLSTFGEPSSMIVVGVLGGVAFLTGLVTPNYMYAGIDGALHLAEECQNANTVVPRALMSTLLIGDLNAVVTSATGVPIFEMWYQATRSSVAATVFVVLLCCAAVFALIGAQQTASRLTWSLARDRAIIGSKWLSRIHPKFEVPVWGLIFNFVIMFIIGCIYLGSSSAFNAFIGSGLVLQHISYAIPAALLMYRKRSEFWLPRDRAFRLPSVVGWSVNAITIGFAILVLIFYDLPTVLPVTGSNMRPTCNKCQKKGIECSGPGRIRFSTGVAQRGRLKGCTIPVADPPPEPFEGNAQAIPAPRKIRWKNDQLARNRRKKEKCAATSLNSIQATNFLTPSNRDTGPACAEPLELRQNHPDVIDGYVDRLFDEALIHVPGSIHRWLAPLNSQTRMLMSHFSEQVAPVMVVLDHVSNGYRDILLPLACEDELLQRAVGVVAAQHLALNNPSYQSVADRGRAALISRLCRDSTSPDRVFNTSTWATLIVLLVGETITGSSEYGHLLRTLMCLVQNADQIAPSSARRFLSQQTHMFEFLGQPLLSENQGVNVLSFPLEHYLDWTYYDLPSDSEHSHILHLSRMAFIKASGIYLGRVASDHDQWQLLESLKQLVSQIEPNQMGSHALVWVCFIAAADSTDPEHRIFFVDRMKRIFAKIKFQNISAGIQALPAIWSQQGSSRWTKNLSQLAPTLIM